MKGEHMGHLLVLITALLGLSVSYAFAQEDVIQKRKAMMKANNADVKAISEAAEKKDYPTIEVKAKDIMDNMGKVVGLFPKGSTDEKSRAHPDVWTKTDEFRARAVDATKAAEALSKAAAAKNEAEVNVKVKELGNNREGACGACHKVFRTDFRKDS
jgi:cytochrome c556